MKNIIHLFSLFVILLSCPVLLIAQQQGYKYDNSNRHKCLSNKQRAEIKKAIQQNREKLNLTVNTNLKNSELDSLIFPIVLAEPVPGYNFINGVSNFVDQDTTDAYIIDYNCLLNTYDNHTGTDFFLFPFAWYLYENDLAHIVSATSGTIVFKQDGNFDQHCEWLDTEQWNAIFIQNPDGSTVWYGHLKSGSLTSKSIGDTVEKGEYLGVVGSSGMSSDAHLHLEYYDENDNLLDPYQGECNELNSNSLWKEQLPYRNQRINAVLTHNAIPKISCGPENEITAFSNEFFLGDTIIMAIYITDYIAGTAVKTNIYLPDGTLFDDFTFSHAPNGFEWFWDAGFFIFIEDYPIGTWKLESKLSNQDEVVTHSFEYLGTPVNVVEQTTLDIVIYPNPVTDKIVLQTNQPIQGSKYSIINFIGETVQSGFLSQKNIPVSNLNNGVYYLILSIERFRFLPQKIIKI